MSDLPPPAKPSRGQVTVSDSYYEQRVTPPSHLDLGSLTVTLMSSDDSFVPLGESEVRAEVEQAFRLHAERWYSDTLILSSYLEKILHPDYQKILTLGPEVVPLILNELTDMPNDWFWALRMLTEADPVEPEQAGDMQAMANAWIEWGKAEGMI
ncbi:MAG TPA: hypothetical protein VJS64_04835 [Pyrinomonadaceae bacterium]|nr:hypothetical protein [Pyrinomonadaceae bacterium]